MKTRIISLVALMLMAFNAKAGDIDDTLKVFRINFYQKVESVKLSGYCKVEIVNDSVEYLEYSNPNKSGTPKGLEYGIGGKYGKQLRIETIPGVDRLRLHLVLDASTDILTEDYAQVDVLCPSNIVKLSVSAEDYSKVTINAERGVDTLRARRIKLAAEDYASVSMGVPCAMDDIALKAQDYAKVNVSYCRGENLKSYEQDRGKVDVESFHVTNTEFSALIDDEEVESPSVIRQLAEERKARAHWHDDDFRIDFLWGFLNWGDKPYNGLMRMGGSYALNTSFSSYQLEAVYYPFVNDHWHLGIGIGYTSDVFKFVDPYVCVAPDAAGVTTFSNSVNYGLTPGSDMTSRLVARYVTLPIMVRWEPSNHSDFFIGLAAIPGLNYNNSHTGLKHRVDNGDDVRTWRDNTTNVMNPFRLDARLSIGLPNIYAYLQMATVPLNTGMDKDVYPIKLGIAISLGDDD